MIDHDDLEVGQIKQSSKKMKYLLPYSTITFKLDVEKKCPVNESTFGLPCSVNLPCEVILIEIDKKKKKKKERNRFHKLCDKFFILKLVNLHCVTIIPPLNPIQA